MNEVPRSPDTGSTAKTRAPFPAEQEPGGSRTEHPVVLDGGTAQAHTAQQASRSEIGSPGSFRKGLQTVATVIGPATLLTALAFYFGWVSTNATFSYFGLDASVMGLTVQEVILSSTDALFVPLGAIVVAALIALAVHSILIRWADREGPVAGRVERISVVMVVVGAVAFLLGIWAVTEGLPFPTPFLFQQLSAGIGVALVAYAVYIRRRARVGTGGADMHDPELRRLWSAGMALVWLIIGLSLFWTVSEYAKALGRGRAQELELSLGEQPSVVIYAERDLHVQGPGVVKEMLSGKDPAYRFRYSGLTFLVRSGGKYFLLPSSWRRSQGGVFVLPETDAVRVEFMANGR